MRYPRRDCSACLIWLRASTAIPRCVMLRQRLWLSRGGWRPGRDLIAEFDGVSIMGGVAMYARNHKLLLSAVLASAFLSGMVFAQPSPMQTCELGDLKLESGEVIRNFRMTYITHGTLNAAKSNAILSI